MLHPQIIEKCYKLPIQDSLLLNSQQAWTTRSSSNVLSSVRFPNLKSNALFE